MPALSYAVSDFQPFTRILSADVNSRFNDIKTLLNVTKLDDANIQDAGITRATKLKLGTANHVIINDGVGAMSSEATLSTSRGGTGATISLAGSNPGDTIQVNPAGTTLILSAPAVSPALRPILYFQYS